MSEKACTCCGTDIPITAMATYCPECFHALALKRSNQELYCTKHNPITTGHCCCCGTSITGLNGSGEWCDWCNEDRCWGVDKNGNEVSFHAEA